MSDRKVPRYVIVFAELRPRKLKKRFFEKIDTYFFLYLESIDTKKRSADLPLGRWKGDICFSGWDIYASTCRL